MIRNKRGQMIVFNLLMLVITIIILTAFIPVLQEVIQGTRGSDSLNCVSTLRVCENSSEPCYNSSLESSTTTCLIMDIFLPYIVIAVLLLVVGALMAGRSEAFSFGGQQQQQQQYQQY